MKKSFVSPSFLKQIAKKIKREKSLKLSQALDEAAKLQGFSNYKNYLNELKVNQDQSKYEKVKLFKDITTETDLSKKVPLAISFLQKFKTPFKETLSVLNQFEHSEEELQRVCNCLNLKDDIEKFMLNYFIESKSDIQALPLKEHFIAKKVLVEDLAYEINQDMLRVDGNYNLAFEFEHEVPEELKNEPHFNREPMFGEFVMTLDQYKKMVIENPSIGEEFDGRIFMGSVKLGRP